MWDFLEAIQERTRMQAQEWLSQYMRRRSHGDRPLSTNQWNKKETGNSAYIPKAKFEFTRTDGDDKQLKHVETGLKNLLISQVIPCIESASRLPENVCLMFAKVKWKYSKQKIGGGAGGQTLCGWDLSQNKIG